MALAEDQLLSGGNDLRGIHVMTVPRQNKEFDAVIIFDDPNSSPLLFNKEAACIQSAGFWRRDHKARHHVLMLTDMYTLSAPIS